jgi:glucose-1-phosphate thymidylyltransferase
MKGVILAGGTGSRLFPLTKVTNKHLLPVYDKPMIYYPLQTLIDAGIDEIMLVSGRGHAGHFLELLGSGADEGVSITYEIQEEAKGIAHALKLTEHWADEENIAVILGDNIYEDNLRYEINNFHDGAKIFLKEVPDAQRFGVAEINGDHIVSIVEKPKIPKTNFAVTGFYVYDPQIFSIIDMLHPSARGELEITDANNFYVKQGKMKFAILQGFWSDAGTFDSLLRASVMIQKTKSKYQHL